MAIEVEGTTGTDSGVRAFTGTHEEVSAQIRAAAPEAAEPSRPVVEPLPAELFTETVSTTAASKPAEKPAAKAEAKADALPADASGASDATPAASEDADGDDDAPEEAPAETAEQRAQSRSRSQRYRDNISALRRQLDETNALNRQLAERLFRDPAPQPAQDAPQAAASAPPPADMLTEEQFFDQHPDAPYGAFTQYVARQEALAAVRAEIRDRDAREAAQKQIEAFTQQHAAWNAKVAEALHADPSFEQALNQDLPDIPAALVAQLITSAQGAEMYRHLVMHPSDAERLGRMVTKDGLPTPDLLRELGRLEATVEHQRARPAAAPPSRTTSRAPRPLDPVPGDASAVRTLDVRSLPADSEGATFATFEKNFQARTRQRQAGGFW